MGNTTNYKELKKIWYKKLAKSGFVDIEKGFENSPYIYKDTARQADSMYKLSNEEYYRQVRIFLTHNNWEDDPSSQWYKFICECHADGITYRKIINLFQDKFDKKISTHFIFNRIQKLKEDIVKFNLHNDKEIRTPEINRYIDLIFCIYQNGSDQLRYNKGGENRAIF